MAGAPGSRVGSPRAARCDPKPKSRMPHDAVPKSTGTVFLTMVPPPHCDTDQSRIVYLVRLISIWYCKWFMLFMTLDMPDEGTR